MFRVKLVAAETPFYSTMALRFGADRVTIDARHHVSFGRPELPTLEGRAAARR